MRGLRLLPAAAVLVIGITTDAGEAVAQVLCEPCHGELELLRQRVATLEEARALLVTNDEVEASAHGASACIDCHRGHGVFPHPDYARTETCASCHADEDALWSDGVHGRDPQTDCASCHGTHGVLGSEELEEDPGMLAMRRSCEACHAEERLLPGDPHADSVACVDCHEPHRTLSANEAGASIHVLELPETCGTCHDSIASVWGEDTHALAVPELARSGITRLDGSNGKDPPACTGCHGTHRDANAVEAELADEVSHRCAACHEEYEESFADSYHGQASVLGSTAVARCHDCHSAHEVHPADDPRSTVSEARLLETCRSCHPEATEGFAAFQPHADHNDREHYPYVYWSYRLMTALLIGVFTVFGLHSVFWLGRSTIDSLRGESGGGASHV